MIANDALHWSMTVLLLAAGLYSAFRAATGAAAPERLDHAFHTVMAAVMVIMLVPGGRWPLLPQLLLLAVGAWWFLLRAVSPRTVLESQPRSHGRRPARGKALYDAAVMAAMAYVVAAMAFSGAPAALPGPSAIAALQAAHHPVGAVPALPGTFLLGWGGFGWTGQAVPAEALAFGLAAAVWAVRVMDQLLSSGGRGRRRSTGRPWGIGDALFEVVGAASMAVMLAVLAG